MAENKALIHPVQIFGELFDEGAFNEIQKHENSSIDAAYGTIMGSVVYAYVQDIHVKSGAVSQNAAFKIKKIYSMAIKCGAPVVAVFNSKGGEIGEGIELIDAYSEILESAARLSGVVPLVSLVMGQCSGLNATLCCMSDIVVMTEDARMFFTPPFIAEDKLENAGSAQVNAGSGVVNIVVENASDAVLRIRELLSILPPNNLEPAFCGDFEPNDAKITGGMNSAELLENIADINSLIELNNGFGAACVTAFGVLDSSGVGFVSFDKPDEKLTDDDASKIARFVNLCDAFSIPVISIINNEGFEPSLKAEQTGFIRDTAKLAQVFASATTPKVTLITGKAAGAAFILAGGFKNDYIIAYKKAVISPIPVKAAATFLEMTEDDYINKHASSDIALQKGYVDEVIFPDEARHALIRAVNAVRDKRVHSPARKHINLVF